MQGGSERTFSCGRRNNNRNARDPPLSWVDPVRGRAMTKTVKPSRWPQSREYGRHLLKQLQAAIEDTRKTQDTPAIRTSANARGADFKNKENGEFETI